MLDELDVVHRRAEQPLERRALGGRQELTRASHRARAARRRRLTPPCVAAAAFAPRFFAALRAGPARQARHRLRVLDGADRAAAAAFRSSKLSRMQSAKNAGSGSMSRQDTAQIHIVPA